MIQVAPLIELGAYSISLGVGAGLVAVGASLRSLGIFTIGVVFVAIGSAIAWRNTR